MSTEPSTLPQMIGLAMALAGGDPEKAAYVLVLVCELSGAPLPCDWHEQGDRLYDAARQMIEHYRTATGPQPSVN